MIPFQLHRRIPFVRRPFDQRDSLLAENAALKTRLAEIEREEEAPQVESKQSLNRAQELKRANVEYVDRAKTAFSHDEAMKASIGGDFEAIGRIEAAIVQYYGLKPDGHLIDVGCGSGRLARPLSAYLRGKYSGFDVVDDFVNYARKTVQRPDWRIEAIEHIGIPEPDGCADMVCFFSVLTHLLHEQSYWYLEEAKRVVKPGGLIIASFLEFTEPIHWPIFTSTLTHAKQPNVSDPINVFIERGALQVWANHLGLEIDEIRNGSDKIVPEGALGQSLCVIRRPD